MKRILSFVFLFLSGLATYASACEFCTVHNGLGQYNNNGDFISITERYTSASTEVNNGAVVKDSPDTKGYAIQINTAQFMYQHSFSEDWKGNFSLPYFDKRSSNNPGASGASDTSSGVGDATALAEYRLWNGHHDQNLWLMAGLKLPTGKEKSTPTNGPSGTNYFNPDLVIGTGSLDELLGFAYSQNIGSFSWAFDTLYKFSNAGYDGYKFGNVLNWGLSGYYRVHNNWNGGIGFVSEVMAADVDTKGNINNAGNAGNACSVTSSGLNGCQAAGPGIVANTGGNVVYLQPTIQYVNQNNYVDLSYQYPVYRNFTGFQTVVDDKIIVAYRHAF